jgi:uncharacterized surface protein with fasciclin (FAS1) repeats
MRTRRLAALSTAVALTLGMAACSSDKKADAPAPSAAVTTKAADAPAAGLKDIIDTAVGAGSFTTLATLLTSAGLVDTLKGPGPFTVFAPTDDAFKAVDKATMDKLAADPALLKKVLSYHVISGAAVKAADVKTGEVDTVAGVKLKLTAEGGKVMAGDANVTSADVMASNGVIHVIDKVLVPAG